MNSETLILEKRTSGFVYILINPSLFGLVKIGKTTRSPEEEAAELSNNSELPTPFFVAFDEYFDNCTVAECYVHIILEDKGYQVSDNLKFFNIPLKEAIRALLEAKDAVSNSKTNLLKRDAKLKPLKNVKEDLLKQAKAFRFGLGRKRKNEQKAQELYRRAAKFGSSEAYIALAEMLVGNVYSLGYFELNPAEKKTFVDALKYLKEAVKFGDFCCLAQIAIYYFYLESYEDADKCWERYFSFLADSKSPRETPTKLKENLIKYIRQVRSGKIPFICGNLIEKITNDSSEQVFKWAKETITMEEFAVTRKQLLTDYNNRYSPSDIENALYKAAGEGTELIFSKLYSRVLKILQDK